MGEGEAARQRGVHRCACDECKCPGVARRKGALCEDCDEGEHYDAR
jgi:hypothetical protein